MFNPFTFWSASPGVTHLLYEQCWVGVVAPGLLGLYSCCGASAYESAGMGSIEASVLSAHHTWGRCSVPQGRSLIFLAMPAWNSFYLFIYLFIYLSIYLFIYLFMAALGLHCCAWTFSSCGEQGLLFVAVSRLLVVEHGL